MAALHASTPKSQEIRRLLLRIPQTQTESAAPEGSGVRLRVLCCRTGGHQQAVFALVDPDGGAIGHYIPTLEWPRAQRVTGGLELAEAAAPSSAASVNVPG